MAPRTILIWDVHGCIEELRELMDKLAPTPEDRVIFLGDIINKGPDPVWVAEYIHRHGYDCVLGNNELLYIKNFKTHPIDQGYHSQWSQEIHDWIANLPPYLEWEDFIAVHGGVVPGLHPRDTDKIITCNIRYWDSENFCMGNTEHIPWYELYAGTKKIIYWHWGAQRLTVRENTIGIDSGCVYGGELSAYILETAEIVQVKAKQVYEEPKIK